MDIYKSNLFPYVSGDNLINKTANVTIKNFTTEALPNHRGELEERYVISFQESPKKLVLNKTNARTIAELHGPETDKWKGQKIMLYGEQIKAFGKQHNVVRIAPAKPENGNTQQPPQDSKPMPEAVAVQAMVEDDPPDLWVRETDGAYGG